MSSSTLHQFLQQLSDEPTAITFNQTMTLIDSLFDFTPTAFKNGDQQNAAGQNNGSCKLFAFAQQQALSVEATLACFGDFYRKDVLENPQGDDHQNIRNFIRHGWSGIEFTQHALSEK